MCKLARGVIFFGASFLLLTAPGAFAQVKAVRDGKTIVLPSSAAARFVPTSGEAEIRIVLSGIAPANVPLADAFGGDGALQDWLRSSGTPAIVIVFKESEPTSFMLNTYGIGEMSYSGGGSASGEGIIGPFSKLDLAKDRVSGQLNHEAGSTEISGSFQAAIATIAEAPAVKGPKVAASPQAQVLIAFAKAMGKMDFKAAQPFAADDIEKSMAEAKEMMGEARLKAMLKERFGDPKTIQALLKDPDVTLAESGDTALIRLKKTTKTGDSQYSETHSFNFRKIDGTWKISM